MMATVIDPDAWFIVVNPASGGGRASRFRPRLLAALERAGLPHQCVESAAPGDATAHFARAADEGCRRLLAVGGDGTLNELVNDLLASGIPTRDCLVAAAAGRLSTCMARARPRATSSAASGRLPGGAHTHAHELHAPHCAPSTAA